jgi:hypothetical protein
MEQSQAKFEGWAVIELFGHNREAGHITTVYFGDKAMFQLDVPAFEERDVITKCSAWQGNQLIPAGSKVRKAATQARSRLISPGAVYAINPCTEEMAKAVIEDLASREIKVVELAKTNQIAQAATSTEEDEKEVKAFEVFSDGDKYLFQLPNGSIQGPFAELEDAESAADAMKAEWGQAEPQPSEVG